MPINPNICIRNIMKNTIKTYSLAFSLIAAQALSPLSVFAEEVTESAESIAAALATLEQELAAADTAKEVETAIAKAREAGVTIAQINASLKTSSNPVVARATSGNTSPAPVGGSTQTGIDGIPGGSISGVPTGVTAVTDTGSTYN